MSIIVSRVTLQVVEELEDLVTATTSVLHMLTLLLALVPYYYQQGGPRPVLLTLLLSSLTDPVLLPVLSPSCRERSATALTVDKPKIYKNLLLQFA